MNFKILQLVSILQETMQILKSIIINRVYIIYFDII